MNRLDIAINGIKTAREYTEQLLMKTNLDQWFCQPSEGVTHIAWQVGHLAFAEYAIALRRIRGARQNDVELLPVVFHTLFGRMSVPRPEPADYPNPAVIREVFDRVHHQAILELQDLRDLELDDSTADPPHPMHKTKFGVLQWCSQHEFLHAGEIALLRRLLGEDALW